MKYIGVDASGEYEYSDIISYDECCNCDNFYDNWHEERFECLRKNNGCERME